MKIRVAVGGHWNDDKWNNKNVSRAFYKIQIIHGEHLFIWSFSVLRSAVRKETRVKPSVDGMDDLTPTDFRTSALKVLATPPPLDRISSLCY